MRSLLGRAALGAAAAAAVACGSSPAPEVTFTRDVAPIVFEHCAGCHRPRGSSPFALLTYAAVRRKARTIVDVAERGFMPPWLPEPGPHPFVGERRLSDAEIDTLRRWVDAGAPEGDPHDLPEPPPPAPDWQLGEPDLVVTLAEPWTLAAEGPDVFRNFVLPAPVERARWVRAVELRPANAQVVHHGILHIDRTPASRALDAEDAEPGFPGMDLGPAVPPDGQFLGWTPGKLPDPGREDTAWLLGPGTDLVLQLHLIPSGKPETIAPAIGLHFADRAPTTHPTVLTLTIEGLDIPAGEAHYTREQRIELPVAVEVLGVYPHAHYLGKEIRGFAELPDGTTTELIHIADWDFNWQEDYRFVEPVALPAGSTIGMRYTWDNSARNPRNPSLPPRRVQSGNRSTDEMGTLTLQLLAASAGERARLDEALARHWLAGFPDAWKEHNNLANALRAQGRLDEALAHYRRALELAPRGHDVRYNLAVALTEAGRTEEGLGELRRVVEDDPRHARARTSLGHALLASGRTAEALPYLEQAVALEPSLAIAHYNLAIALAAVERAERALEHYRAAIENDPDFAMAHNNLGALLHARGATDEAIRHYRRALDLAPDNAEAHNNLGLALVETGRSDEAVEHFRRALALDPALAVARANLDRALAGRPAGSRP
jgi:tetratricopeptide (TPR) repeat protein/mono/diheme cytochrome c family protein